MEKFALGIVLGGVGGALLVANNYKMRTLVRKTQEELQAKLDAMLDEKIRGMETMTDEVKNTVEEKVQEVAPKKTARKPATKTAEYVLREMRSPEGGFYSADNKQKNKT